jgi:hypothetical protein
LVLLVLAAIWAAVLIPPAVRARANGRPGDSISAFHRQLSVLRRTGPKSHRHGMADHWSRPSTPLAPPLAPLGRTVGAPTRAGGGPRPIAAVPSWAGMRAPGATPARSRTLRRRRDILTALVVAAAATLVLGALPFLRMLWAAHLAFDVLLIAYVALLIRQRNVAAEREMKVRFLPSPGSLEPAMVRPEPALLRRTAAN